MSSTGLRVYSREIVQCIQFFSGGFFVNFCNNVPSEVFNSEKVLSCTIDERMIIIHVIDDQQEQGVYRAVERVIADVFGRGTV